MGHPRGIIGAGEGERRAIMNGRTTRTGRLRTVLDAGLDAGRGWLGVAAGLLALLVGAADYGHAQEAAPVVVAPAEVAADTVPVRLVGTVTAARRAELSPRVSGLVSGPVPDAGHRVRRGATLVTLDSTLAEIRLNQSLAELDQARALLADAERLSEEAKALDANIAETVRRSRAAEVQVRQAALARLEAEYWYQAELIDRHKVIAPFDGIVVRKFTETGEWVETGTPVLEFLGTDAPRIDVQVPQAYFQAIDPERPAKVAVDALPGQSFTARIGAKVPVGDADARTFLVRLDLPDADPRIVPGMSAEVSFSLPAGETGVTVPRDAIVRYPDGTTTVWVVDDGADGVTARERQVRLGRAAENQVWVVDGLAAGTRVVVKGNEILEDGARIAILEDDADGPGAASMAGEP